MKTIWLLLGAGGLAGAGYLAWRYFEDKRIAAYRQARADADAAAAAAAAIAAATIAAPGTVALSPTGAAAQAGVAAALPSASNLNVPAATSQLRAAFRAQGPKLSGASARAAGSSGTASGEIYQPADSDTAGGQAAALQAGLLAAESGAAAAGPKSIALSGLRRG